MEEPTIALSDSNKSNAKKNIENGSKLESVISTKEMFKKPRKYSARSVALVILFCVLTSALITISILYSEAITEVCTSDKCLRTAASMKALMDESADPCDDFYQYACGRWKREHSSMCPPIRGDLINNWFAVRSNKVTREIQDLISNYRHMDHLSGAIEKVEILYESCVNRTYWDKLTLQPVYQLLQDLAIPRTPAIFTKNKSDFVVQIANIKRIIGSDIFFNVHAELDPRNSSRSILGIFPPSIGNPFAGALGKKLDLAKIITSKEPWEYNLEFLANNSQPNIYEMAVKSYRIKVIKYIMSNGTIGEQTCNSPNNDFTEIVEKEIERANDNIDKIRKRIVAMLKAIKGLDIDEITKESLENQFMTLDQLQNLTDKFVISVNETLKPKLKWKSFVLKMFDGIEGFDPQQKFFISSLDYLKNISLLIASTNHEDIETYIWWNIIAYTVPYSTKPLRKMFRNLVEFLSPGIEFGCNRAMGCTGIVKYFMDEIISHLYIRRKQFSSIEQRNIREMFTLIRASFKNSVRQANWMDEDTKDVTLDKADMLQAYFGFPKWLLNYNNLNNFYMDMNLKVDDYLSNMIEIIKSFNTKELKSYTRGAKGRKETWYIPPTVINAIHVYQLNQIYIPLAILEFPFYDLGLQVLNYAAMGSVVGHEFTHGFDDSGRRFSINGTLEQWWSNETISNYKKKSECFIKQYSNYFFDELDARVDGEKTLDENIADNGGFTHAFKAYKLWKRRHGSEPLLPGFTHLSHDQLFYLGFAHMWCGTYTKLGLKYALKDVHSPDHVRVLTTLKNSKHFSEAWKCPVGSDMNPQKKCEIW